MVETAGGDRVVERSDRDGGARVLEKVRVLVLVLVLCSVLCSVLACTVQGRRTKASEC